MAKFTPREIEQEPVLIRYDGGVICLTEYRMKEGGKILPIDGFFVTKGYERLRGKDARAGMPLLSEFNKTISAGEIAYRAKASEAGWGVSWEELSSEEKASWQAIARSVLDYADGSDVPYIF